MPYKDPEEKRANREAYDATHRNENKARAAAWRKACPERVRAVGQAYNAAHREERRAQWMANQRSYSAANHANTSAKRAGAAGRITAAEARAVLALGRCAYCEREATIGLDHILPLSRGGRNDPANLAPCCNSCNPSKGDRTPEEWRAATA